MVGDSALRAVAEGIRRLIHPEGEILCRYGGDEFCIASLRNAAEAELLAENVKRIIHVIALPEIPNETIQVSIGVRGGKRTHERENVHYAATLNNLINLASRDCIANKNADAPKIYNGSGIAVQSTPKPTPREEAILFEGTSAWENIGAYTKTEMNGTGQNGKGTAKPAPLSIEDMLHLNRLEITWDQAVAHVAVEIEGRNLEGILDVGKVDADENSRKLTENPSAARQTFGSLVSREIGQDALPMLVAEATLAALQRVLPDDTTICLEEVIMAQTNSGRDMVTVLAHVATPYGNRSLTGTALVAEDAPRAVAAAVLTACNSLLDEASSVTTVTS